MKDLLNEMQNKAKDLENDSYGYKKTAGDVRKLECRKKFVILELFRSRCCYSTNNSFMCLSLIKDRNP